MKVELQSQQEEKNRVIEEASKLRYACGLRCPPRADPARPCPTVGIDHFVPVGGFTVCEAGVKKLII
jgi:hypothetical protein